MTNKMTPPHFSTVFANDILWSPTKEHIEQANSTKFISHLNQLYNLSLESFTDLYQWSIENPESFWDQLWDFTGVIGEKGVRVLDDKHQMPGATWFSDSNLNFAENLLNERHTENLIRQLLFFGVKTSKNVA